MAEATVKIDGLSIILKLKIQRVQCLQFVAHILFVIPQTSQHNGNSGVIRDHTVLPAIRQRRRYRIKPRPKLVLDYLTLFCLLQLAIFGLARTLCMETIAVPPKKPTTPRPNRRDHVTHQMTHVIGGWGVAERRTIKSPILPYNKWEQPKSTHDNNRKSIVDTSPITPRRNYVTSGRVTSPTERESQRGHEVSHCTLANQS